MIIHEINPFFFFCKSVFFKSWCQFLLQFLPVFLFWVLFFQVFFLYSDYCFLCMKGSLIYELIFNLYEFYIFLAMSIFDPRFGGLKKGKNVQHNLGV